MYTVGMCKISKPCKKSQGLDILHMPTVYIGESGKSGLMGKNYRHTYTHIHRHTHTQIHTHTTNTHTNTHTQIHTHKQILACIHILSAWITLKKCFKRPQFCIKPCMH